MLTKLLGCAVAIGLAAGVAAPVQAANFNYAGNFSQDNDVQLFEVNVTSGVGVVETTSWGTGGFDPYLTLFTQTGQYTFEENNDIDTAAGEFDARLFLTPGSYLVALTQSDNAFDLSNIADLDLDLPTLITGQGSTPNAGFEHDPHPTFTQNDTLHPTQNLICGNDGPFCGNTSGWTVTFSDVNSASPVAPVPLPAPVGLFIAALGSLGLIARRRKTA